MKETLVPGVTGEGRHRVVTEDLVSFRRAGMPPVLATPWLLDVMETASTELTAGARVTRIGNGDRSTHPRPCQEGNPRFVLRPSTCRPDRAA